MQPSSPAGAVDSLLLDAEEERRNGRVNEAIALAERALPLAAGNSLDTARVQLELGNLLRYVPETVRALQLLGACERTFRELSHPKLPRVLTIKAMALGDAGEHAGALPLYHEALRLLESPERERDAGQEANCIGGLGLACTQLGDFAQAEDAYRRSIALYTEAGKPEANAFVFNNLAILRVRAIQALADRGGAEAIRLGEEMLAFVREGLAANEAHGRNPLPQALLLNTQGDGLRALGRVVEALPILSEALRIYRTMSNPRGEIDAATDLAAAHLEVGRIAEARALLEEARSRVEGRGLKDHERRLEELLAEACERDGDAAAALAHFKAFHRLHRELQDLEAQRSLQRIALRSEIDKALRESREDALTGIANRRRFEEVSRDHDRAPPARFAVAVLDIDHFKRINDQLSHDMGDQVLREVGRILRLHCREADFVARIGGEEFIQLLRGANAEEARHSCERLRAAVESHPWHALDGRLAVTVSVGIAAGDGRTPLGDLMKVADARLYEAKRAGRNRVVAEDP